MNNVQQSLYPEVQNPYNNIYEKYYLYLDLPEIRVGRARKTKDQLGVALVYSI